MKILIPMSGAGRRFKEKGYTFPKPLIDVNGKSMIEVVLESLPKADEYIFIVQKEHESQYKISDLLQKLTDGKSTVFLTDGVTEGAACSALLARERLNDYEPLLIANSDQYVKYSKPNFELICKLFRETEAYDFSGMIFTFNATHPKWSFVKIEYGSCITQVVEKTPISDIATCGIYYWGESRDFVRSADAMIAANDRVNGEFYIAPTFNYLIKEDTWVAPFYVDEMHGLGTPEDLELFLRR